MWLCKAKKNVKEEVEKIKHDWLSKDTVKYPTLAMMAYLLLLLAQNL